MAGDQSNTYTSAEIWAEVKIMRKFCLPIVATNLMSYLKGMVSVACMGRLGPLELAGGSLAIGLTNITSISILSGLSLALDPICSQAAGSGNPSLAASALRRTVLLLLLASLPIAALWSSLSRLLLFLGLDPAVVAVAQSYALSSLPSLLSSSLHMPLRCYLRALSRPFPLAAASAFTSLCLHLPLAPLLARPLGISGIVLSSSLTEFATLLLLVAYFSFYRSTDDDQAYIPLQAEMAPVADGWAPLLRLALPCCLGVCMEWWLYELMTISTSYLTEPRAALGSAGIIIQITALLYTLPSTLGSVAASRVGNELGAGHPSRARAAATVAMEISIMGSCFSLTWATLGRETWARVFTSDDAVLQVTRVVLPIIGLCEIGNCPQTTGCGVLRGCARPAVGATINLYSFYFIGAPMAIMLAIGLNMGFIGLCLGLLAAQMACAVSILVVMWWTDWGREAQKAINLVGPKGVKAEDIQGLLREEDEILK